MTQTTIHTADITAWLRGNQWLVQNGYMPKAHAVIGDPPYFLGTSVNKGFMGQKWDGFANLNDYQAWVTEWATLLLDFVHPGAVLALFGGTRTYHRLACGLEEAGWEIFDSMMYVYGSGFPKSHDISKALDREAGATREIIPGKRHEKYNTKNGTTFGGSDPLAGHWNTITAPATPDAATWNGYGTALKPAYETIVLARAPRGGRTYAQLAREFGTAALNVDGGRIDVLGDDPNKRKSTGGCFPSGKPVNLFWNNGSRDATLTQGRWPANFALAHSPDCGATCAPGCPVAALGEMSGESVSTQNRVSDERANNGNSIFLDGKRTPQNSYDDSGNASRFFYTAKASAFEREAGLAGFEERQANHAYGDGLNTETKIRTEEQRENGVNRALRRNPHPTVKPIQLIEWLATLLLPPAGIGARRLLVPFAGSGSEMIGAQLAGFDVITGIEQSAEYAAIAKARLAWWSQFTSYDDAKERYDSEQRGAAEDAALEQAGQLRLFELAS